MSDTTNTTAAALDVEQLPADLDAVVDAALGAVELAQLVAPDLVAVIGGISSGELVAVDREQLADLIAFAGFARDRLYPLVEALAPVAHRATEIGAELQTMGPLQLVNLLTGR